jgi:hypothetical protein
MTSDRMPGRRSALPGWDGGACDETARQTCGLCSRLHDSHGGRERSLALPSRGVVDVREPVVWSMGAPEPWTR